MSRKSLAIAAMAVGMSPALAADLPYSKGPPVAPAAIAPFFVVNDNTFSLSYQFTATDPGIRGTTGKSVVNFTHFDIWAYGANFFTIDLLKSGHNDPAAPCQGPGQPLFGCAGSTEIYGLFRSTLGFNQMFNTKAFSVGPLSNVSLEWGADANTQNNFVGPAKKDVVFGLQFSFDLPWKGHLNISPLLYKEWNHNAFLMPTVFGGPFGPVDGNTDFNATWDLEMNYALPLGFLPEMLPLTLSGYGNFHGPKGRGVDARTGVPKTVVEFNSEQKLSLDVAKMVAGAKYSGFLDVWVAYRYWQNKFGLDHSRGVCVGPAGGGCTEQSWVSGVSMKF